MFMIDLLIETEGNCTQTCTEPTSAVGTCRTAVAAVSRPAALRHRSELLKTLSTLLSSPLLVTGLSIQQQQQVVRLVEVPRPLTRRTFACPRLGPTL